MRVRIVITVVVAALVLLTLPGAALAWSNGPNGANGFGTHDWVLKEANRLAATQNAGWVRLNVALPKTDDPDTVFHDFYYHVYDVWGSRYGDAPRKVALFYGKALAARKAGDWRAASKWVGIMAHYYADICNPLHTDQSRAEERMHSAYESAAQRSTDAPGENRSWVAFNGYRARSDVAGFTKDTAATSHKYYAALVKGYNSGGMNATVLSITRKRVNGAVNGLADLIIAIKKGVKGTR